jgi:hypothetical protein
MSDIDRGAIAKIPAYGRALFMDAFGDCRPAYRGAFPALAEEIVALAARFIRNTFQETRPVVPTLAAMLIYC